LKHSQCAREIVKGFFIALENKEKSDAENVVFGKLRKWRRA
jgi:hypothetical protein